MADLEKTIAIIFSGVDELSGPINRMSKKIDSFGSSMEDFGAPFASATQKIMLMNAALTTLAVGGLVLAFNESVKFENSVIELKKVLGDGAGVDTAIDEATRLSEIYGQSADSILLSAADFKQAGFDIEDALNLTADSMDLVIAGNIEAAQSSELIISALKGFGEEADQARRFIDILNEVSNNYATDVEQLAIGMSKLSPIAKTMGFSMEEAAGLLVPVIEIFRSGDEAAVALKTGLLKLIDDSKPVAAGLAAIGVAQRDANGELRSGKDIYFDVATAFQTMDEKQKLFITQQVVGIHQAAKMVTVFDNLALANKITATAMESSGSAAREVAERLKSAEVSVNLFKTSFENLSRTIGDQFRVAAQEAIDGGTDIEQALRNIVASGTFEPVFVELNAFAKKIGTFLTEVAQNLPAAFEGVDFSGLLDALGDVGDSIGGVFDDFDLTTPEGLQQAIQAVIDTLESLARTSSGIIESLTLISNSVIVLIKTFNDLDPDTKKLAGNILGLGTALVTLGGVVKVGGVLLSGFGTFTGLFSSSGILATGITGIIALLSGPAGLAVGLGALGAAVVNFSFKSMNDEHKLAIAALDAHGNQVQELINQMEAIPAEKSSEIFVLLEADDLEGAKKLIDEMVAEEKEIAIQAKVQKEEFDKFFQDWDGLSDEKAVELTAAINAGDFQKVEDMIAGITEDKQVDINAVADVTKAKEELEWFDDEGNRHTIIVDVEAPGVANVKKEIEQIPTEKMLEIQLQGDIDERLELIKASAATAQTAFEWTAKLNIADVEAQAQIIESAYGSINTSITSTADLMGQALSALSDPGSFTEKWAAEDILRDEARLRQQSFELQEKLTNAQVDYMEAKTDSLSEGLSEITISSDGLEPALETIMWQILEKIQVRATASASEFLLGL